MTERDIEWSSNLRSACDGFAAEVRQWIAECIAEEDLDALSGSHDQGTYTTSWEPLLSAGMCPEALEFLRAFRDAIRNHFEATGAWHHGYWKRQEAHHGTEHFDLFLGTLYRLDPGDSETARQILDAAEHIGNWVDEVPPWFDWDSGLFRSMYLGTEHVGDDERTALNVPDHIRLVNLCLLAHEASGQDRYLDLAALHGGLWADALNDANDIPAGLGPAGPVYSLARDGDTAYHGFAGMAGDLQLQVDRTENLFASGAVDALLRLWRKTDDKRFRFAAERLLETLSTQIAEPDGGCAAPAFRLYRAITEDERYDRAIADACAGLQPRHIASLGIQPGKRSGPRLPGLGQRNDKPAWFEDGKPRRHNPLTLALHAEWTGDADLATAAVDIARTAFRLGREVLEGNRHHGCAANTDSALARGHGRENNAGLVTAVLGPMMKMA